MKIIFFRFARLVLSFAWISPHFCPQNGTFRFNPKIHPKASTSFFGDGVAGKMAAAAQIRREKLVSLPEIRVPFSPVTRRVCPDFPPAACSLGRSPNEYFEVKENKTPGDAGKEINPVVACFLRNPNPLLQL